MSIVIIGGHDRMVCQYMKICKNYKCKAKVFTQMPACLNKQVGTRPDMFHSLHEYGVPQDGEMRSG